MRDRLVKLVKASLTRHIDKSCKLAENIADDLLKDGVIVPPVKVGDVVWVVGSKCLSGLYGEPCAKDDTLYCNNCFLSKEFCAFEREVDEWLWHYLTFNTDKHCHFVWGKTVFLTKEEAKRALAEREKYD